MTTVGVLLHDAADRTNAFARALARVELDSADDELNYVRADIAAARMAAPGVEAHIGAARKHLVAGYTNVRQLDLAALRDPRAGAFQLRGALIDHADAFAGQLRHLADAIDG